MKKIYCAVIYWRNKLDLIASFDNENQAVNWLLFHEQCTDDVRDYKLKMLDEDGWHLVLDYSC